MSDEWVVWGFKLSVLPIPIKLSGGSIRKCNADMRQWAVDSWICAIYRSGTSPIGLRDQAQVAVEHE